MADPTAPTPGIDTSLSAPPTWDQIRTALSAVPEAQGSPTLAASTIQGTPASVAWSADGQTDATGTAQAAAAAANFNAADETTKKHKGGFWHDVGGLVSAVTHVTSDVWDQVPLHKQIDAPVATVSGGIKEGLGFAAKWANYPLAQVQHSYRYYRQIQQSHGNVAALGEWLKNSWGGLSPASGVAMPYANHIGTEISGGNTPPPFVTYPDAWDKAAGLHISPGRDLAGLFQLKPGNGWEGKAYTAVSGTGDAVFDIATDPTLKMGEISKALKLGAKGIAGADDVLRAAQNAKGVSGAINPLYAGTGRAIRDMAADNSAASLMQKYPGLQYIGGGVDHDGNTVPTMLEQIAKAKTYDDVVDVMRAHALANEFVGAKIMPNLSLTRIPFRKASEMFKSWQLPNSAAVDALNLPVGPLTEAQTAAKDALDKQINDPGLIAKAKNKAARIVATFQNDTPFAIEGTKIVGTGGRIDPANPAAARVLYQILKYGQSDNAAKLIAQQFSDATTIGAKATIWHNAILSTFHAAGVPQDASFGRKLLNDLDAHADVAGTSSGHEYMVDETGKLHPGFLAPDGVTRVKGAVASTQFGDLYVPKYMEDFVSPARSTRAYIAMYGRMDDWVYEHLTKGFFKRNVLATGGFAWRNAASENLTAVIGDGGVNVIRAGIEAGAAKLKYKFMNEEEKKAVLASLVDDADEGTMHRLADDPSYLQLAVDQQLRHEGHITPAVVSTHHMSASGMSGDLSSDMVDNSTRKLYPGVHALRYDHDKWIRIDAGHGMERFTNAVASHVRTLAEDGGMRVQAQAFRHAYKATKMIEEGGGAAAKGLTESEMQEIAHKAAVRAGHKWMTETPAGKAFTQRAVGANMPSELGRDPLWDLADLRAHAVRGMTTNSDGEVIHSILDGIADSSKHLDPGKVYRAGDKSVFRIHPNLQPTALKKASLDELPQAAPGMEVAPMGLSTVAGRIVDQGFSKVLSPAIQYLSRNGIYLNYLKEELANARRIPGMTEDEAVHLSEMRAAERTVPKIHNPKDRALFGELMRNYIPFYFARQQSFRRLGNALTENPLGFRNIQLAYHGMKDTGFVATDPKTGEDQFTYPLTGELGRVITPVLNKFNLQAATGIPSGFRGDITGLAPGGDVPGGDNTTAGWSPMVTFGLKGLGQIFPDFKPVGAKVAGPLSQDQSWWSALAPNSAVRNMITAYSADANTSRTFANAMVDAMQYAYAHGNTPPADAAPGSPGWQKWIDQLRSQTRLMFTIRAFYGIGSPTSPILQQGDLAPRGTNFTDHPRVGLAQEFQNYLNKYGLGDGTKRYLEKYPNATAYTIFKTEGAGGVNVPETHAALDWAQKNKSFIEKQGEVGSFFVPQEPTSDPDALSVWKQQMASGLRHQKSPDEFAQQMVIQDGWNRYEADHDAFLKSVAGLDPTSDQFKAAKQNFNGYVQNVLAPAAPLWFADYNSSDVRSGNKLLMVKQLQDLFDKGKVPDSPMASPIRGLLEDYANYQAAYHSDDPTAPSKTAQKDNWNAYLATVIQSQPELTSVINRVFKGL